MNARRKPQLSYGEGTDPDGSGQGVWWVQIPAEVGFSIEWFDTEKQAKRRFNKLLPLSTGGESK